MKLRIVYNPKRILCPWEVQRKYIFWPWWIAQFNRAYYSHAVEDAYHMQRNILL